MSVDPLDRLKDLKAEYEADQTGVVADLAQLEQTRDELERKRDRLQELIEGVDKLLARYRDGYTQPKSTIQDTVSKEPDSTLSKNETPPTNGLPENPTRRQVILRIIPSFHGKPFTAGDIRQKFVQGYLKEEPPNFPQAINNLLKRMVESGEVEEAGRDGEGTTAPWLYREKKREGTLGLES